MKIKRIEENKITASELMSVSFATLLPSRIGSEKQVESRKYFQIVCENSAFLDTFLVVLESYSNDTEISQILCRYDAQLLINRFLSITRIIKLTNVNEQKTTFFVFGYGLFITRRVMFS